MKISKWFTAVAIGLALTTTSLSSLAQAVAGRDYRTLSSPQPVTTGARIEVRRGLERRKREEEDRRGHRAIVPTVRGPVRSIPALTASHPIR